MKKITPSLNTIIRYKRNSIFFKYFKMFLGIILIPTFIVMIIYIIMFYRATNERIEHSCQQAFSYVENGIVSFFDESEKLYQTLVSESSVQAFMETDNILNMSAINKRNLLNNINFVSSYTSTSKYIRSVSLYAKKCGYILDNSGNNYQWRLQDLPWLSESNPNAYYYIIPPKNNSNEFYICYNYFSNNESVGIVALKLDMTDIISYLEASYPQKSGLVIADSSDRVIYSYNKENVTFLPDNVKNNLYHRNNKVSLRTVINGNTVTFTASDKVLLMPEFVFFILMCILISAIVALLLSLVLSYRAHSTINNLIMRMNNVTYDENTATSEADEIIYLTTNMINIIDRNKQLENELLSSVTSLNNMQFQMLQTQFSPHFLFNVLNTLHMYLMENYGIDNKISNIIIPLCDILTDSLNTSLYMVTIAEEIDYTKKYIELQKIMTENSFDVIWDVDEDVKNLHTVKLTVQPIVENALKHGIKPLINKAQRGTINIRIKKSEDIVEFAITNDGPPVNAEEFTKIQHSLDTGDFPSDKHIGLKNVNKRIQLIYGNKYGCRISNDGKKTMVKITIPIVEKL